MTSSLIWGTVCKWPSGGHIAQGFDWAASPGAGYVRSDWNFVKELLRLPWTLHYQKNIRACELLATWAFRAFTSDGKNFQRDCTNRSSEIFRWDCTLKILTGLYLVLLWNFWSRLYRFRFRWSRKPESGFAANGLELGRGVPCDNTDPVE